MTFDADEYCDDPVTMTAVIRGCKDFDDAVGHVRECRNRNKVRTAVQRFLQEYDPRSWEAGCKVKVDHEDLVRLQRALESDNA